MSNCGQFNSNVDRGPWEVTLGDPTPASQPFPAPEAEKMLAMRADYDRQQASAGGMLSVPPSPALDRTDYSTRIVQTNTAAMPEQPCPAGERVDCKLNGGACDCTRVMVVRCAHGIEQPSPARSDMLDAERVLSYSKWSAEFIVKHRRAPTAKEAWGFLAAQATPAGGTQAEHTVELTTQFARDGDQLAEKLTAAYAEIERLKAERAPSGEGVDAEELAGLASSWANADIHNAEKRWSELLNFVTGARRATAGTTAAPSGDQLRAIAKEARLLAGSSDAPAPEEFVLAGWRAARSATAGNAAPSKAEAGEGGASALRAEPASQQEADKAARAWMEAHGYGNQSFGFALADLQSRIEAKDREGVELARKLFASNTATAAPGDLRNVTRFNVYENCHVPQGHEVVPEPSGDYVLYADVEKLLASNAGAAPACRHCDGHGSYEHKGSVVDCRVCGGTGTQANPPVGAAQEKEQ